jgi:hypothetical protein
MVYFCLLKKKIVLDKNHFNKYTRKDMKIFASKIDGTQFILSSCLRLYLNTVEIMILSHYRPVTVF